MCSSVSNGFFVRASLSGFGFHHVFEVAEALLRFTADEAELRDGVLQAPVVFVIFIYASFCLLRPRADWNLSA